MLYVDDQLIFNSCNSRVVEIKLQLGAKYKMKYLDLVNSYLGIDFICSTNVDLFLHQKKYTMDLLSNVDKSDVMTEIIPLPMDPVLEVDNYAPSVDASQHCHLVGKLIYLCKLIYLIQSFICCQSSQSILALLLEIAMASFNSHT